MPIQTGEEINQERAKRLRALRDYFGISRAKMASELEITQTTLANYEKGVTRVPVVYVLYLELLAQKNIDADRIYAKIANAAESLGANRVGARAVIDKKPWELQAIADARTERKALNARLEDSEDEE